MAVTKRGIYYPNDGTQKADVMTDMQKMAESIDDALGENQFDPTQINEKIVNLQVSQSTQDLAIENLQGAFLNSNADEDESIEINDASGLGKLSVLGNYVQNGEPSTGSPIPIICVGSNKKNLFSKNNKLENAYFSWSQKTIIKNDEYDVYYFKLEKGKNYVLSFKYTGGAVGAVKPSYAYIDEEPEIGTTIDTTIYHDWGTSLNNMVFNGSRSDFLIISMIKDAFNTMYDIQLEEGTKATNYVPYGMGSTEVKIENADKTQSKSYTLTIQEEMLKGDYFLKEADGWKEVHNWVKIDSYNGESINTDYVSTTGALTTGATVFYKINTPTKLACTNEQVEILEQLNNLELFTGTNYITTVEGIAILKLKYQADSSNLEEIKQDISDLQTSQKDQDSDISALMNALPSETQEGETVNIKGTIPVKFKEFVVGGNNKQESREGYNLLKYNDDLVNEYVINGITFTINDDKSITANGTATANATFNFVGGPSVYPLELESGDYILSGCEGGSASKYYIEIYDGTTYRACQNGKATFNTTGTSIRVYISVKSGVTVNNVKFYPMIVKGTEEKDYEPYGAMPSKEFPSPVKCVGSNVNRFNMTNLENGGYYSGIVGDVLSKNSNNTRVRLNELISVKSNTQYSFSINTEKTLRYNILEVGTDNIIKKVTSITNTNSTTFTTTEETAFITFLLMWQTTTQNITTEDLQDCLIKLEEGDTATSYSPYNCGNANITKCNKNLYKLDVEDLTRNGVDYNVNNGTITAKRSTAAESGSYFNTNRVKIPAGTYIVSGIDNSYIYEKARIEVYASETETSNATRITTLMNTRLSYQYTSDKPFYISFSMVVTTATDIGETFTFRPQVELNTVATEFEEHQEENYILPVQQEMIEGDYFDLENGKEVHKFIKKKITSADGWFIGSNPNQETTSRLVINCSVPGLSADKINAYSNYFPAKTANYLWNNEEIGVAQSQSQLIIRVEKSEFPDISSFNNFIDTHDVYIYYTAPEPIELDLTEEQSTILEQLSNMKAYEGETNIFSTDETSPIFKITAVQKASALLTQVNDLNNKIAQLSQQILEIAGSN